MKKSGTSTHFKDHYGDPFCWADSPKNAGGPQWEIFCIMVSIDINWNIPLGTWTTCYVPNYWVRWFTYHNEHFSWQIIWFPDGNKTDDQLFGTKSTKTTGTGPPSWRVQCFGKQKVDTFPHEKLARNLNWSWSKDKLCVRLDNLTGSHFISNFRAVLVNVRDPKLGSQGLDWLVICSIHSAYKLDGFHLQFPNIPKPASHLLMSYLWVTSHFVPRAQMFASLVLSSPERATKRKHITPPPSVLWLACTHDVPRSDHTRAPPVRVSPATWGVRPPSSSEGPLTQFCQFCRWGWALRLRSVISMCNCGKNPWVLLGDCFMRGCACSLRMGKQVADPTNRLVYTHIDNIS